MDKNTETAGAAGDKAHIAIGGRLMSMDAFRGFDMCWIIGGGAVLGSLIWVCQEKLVLTSWTIQPG